jgi:acetyl-CoA acyltransferase 1
MKGLYEDAVDEVKSMKGQLRSAKKIIRDQVDQVSELQEEAMQLRTRIRENRERFNMLRSPGGIFYGLASPKQPALSTPQQSSRGTPKQASKASGGRRESRADRNSEHKFEALIQALNQENTSAPSTPMPSLRPPPRAQSKHTRNVQSLSSLPTTPTRHTRPDGHLLPSAQLIPQTEPVHRFTTRRYLPDSRLPPRDRVADNDVGRRSRESTISVPDEEDANAELARQALASVASLHSVKKASTSLTMAAGGGPVPRRTGEEDEEMEMPQSQASVAASEMLRRDPRESFEVASSADSRDGTPAPDPRTQALLSNMARLGEKRKFSGTDDTRREALTSPPKKVRMGGPDPGKVGLGINY